MTVRERVVEHVFGETAGVLTPARALLLGVSFGLVLGVAEGAHGVLYHALSPKPTWAYSADVVWMAPLGALAVFGALAAVTAVMTAVGPIPVRLRTVAAAQAWLAWYALIRFTLVQVDRPAAAILALGLAVQTARWILRQGERFWPRCRLTTLALAAVVAVAALVRLAPRWSDPAYTDAVPRDGAPNVLLIVLDTVRAPSLELHGYVRPTTPRLSALAEDGVVFDRAIAPSPWTLPSHASLFTGVPAHAVTADWGVPLDARPPVIAEVLRRSGYATYGVVANLVYCTSEVGLARGFDVYEDHDVGFETLLQRSWIARRLADPIRSAIGDTDLLARKDAPEVSTRFLEWMDGRPSRPFFAFLNYYDAHGPYLPPPEHRTRFGGGDSLASLDDHARSHDPDDLRRLQDGYDNAIAYLDGEIGELLDALERRALLDDTVVIVTSDHGEELGEHGLVDHGNSLYLPSLHVPLLVVARSRVPRGLRVAAPVELRDVAATILDLCGVGTEGIGGTSLGRHWRAPDGPATPNESVVARSRVSTKPWDCPDWFPAAAGDMESVVDARFHYILRGDGVEELYDLIADPSECVDVAGEPAVAEDLTRLRRLCGAR